MGKRHRKVGRNNYGLDNKIKKKKLQKWKHQIYENTD